MRMRKKKNVHQRIEKCGSLYVQNPTEYKGNWNELFGNDNPIHIEVGCGKGNFISGMAKAHPDVNYIAVELCIDVMVIAVEKAFESNVSNVKFINADARLLAECFAEGECGRVYLNFSDPWPKSGHYKRRLTYKDFLDIYRRILTDDGEIHFKTDNMHLFEFSICSFSQNNFKLKNVSLDLHNSNFEGNVMTEYEQRFSELGQPIYRLEAY